MATYAREYGRFEEAGLAVVAISVDSSEQNAAMVEKLLIPFPLLSDPEGAVIKEYGVWNPGEGGISRPALFLVGAAGEIIWSYVGEDYADRPSDDELIAAVGRLA